jgi:hypothetical protein
VPDFRHAHLDRGANGLAPDSGPFIVLGPVIEHFFHAMLWRVAVVHAEQIIRFARSFSVLGRPRVVDFLEYCQCHYHFVTFRFLFSPDPHTRAGNLLIAFRHDRGLGKLARFRPPVEFVNRRSRQVLATGDIDGREPALFPPAPDRASRDADLLRPL